MAKVIVTKDRYTTDSLYQWDLNQVLEITGLSLPSVPEIHFVNDTMDRAIVRQASMNAAGVVTVYVPNALLQKPYKIKAYICLYKGDSFKSEYLIEIPVVARVKPNDYIFEDDAGEIYSFNALENYVNETVSTLVADWTAYVDECKTAVTNCNQAVKDCESKADQAVADCKEQTDNAIAENNATIDATVFSILGHNHEGFDRLASMVDEEELNSLLSEQFDQMDFNSSRRFSIGGIVGLNAMAVGGECFVTLRKGSEFTSTPTAASAVAQFVLAYPDGEYQSRVFFCEKYRFAKDEAWSEFIWQNPPLDPSVEYATSEFFDGKRVYTMFINTGYLPNSTMAGGTFLSNVNHGLIIRATGFTSGYRTIPFNDGRQSISLSVEGDNIWITTNYDASASKGFVQVWYLRPLS